MKFLIKQICVLLVLAGVMSACNTSDVILGKSLRVASDNFKIVEPLTFDRSVIDFSDGSLKVGLKFNEVVDFTISFRGKKSGAYRSFDFQADQLSLSDDLWNGNHEGLFFFKEEAVDVKVKFVGSSKHEINKEVTISSVRDFLTENPNKIVASKYYSFEVPNVNASSFWPYWGMYGSSQNRIYTSNNAIQGDNILRLESASDKIGYRAGGDMSYSERENYPLGNFSANDIFLNFYLLGTNDPNITVDVMVNEDEDGSGLFSPKTEDRYIVTLPLDFEGWKLFSFRYSDLPRATNLDWGGNGNGIRETSKMKNISVTFNSLEKGKKFVELDNIFFTIGKPFDGKSF